MTGFRFRCIPKILQALPEHDAPPISARQVHAAIGAIEAHNTIREALRTLVMAGCAQSELAPVRGTIICRLYRKALNTPSLPGSRLDPFKMKVRGREVVDRRTEEPWRWGR